MSIKMFCKKHPCLIAGVAATGAAVLLYLKTSNNQELTKRKGLGLDHYWPYNVIGKHTNSSVKAHVVSQCQDFENVLDLFLQELQHVKVIGFDCEWTSLSGKPLPVALLQLSTVSGFCLLIRLCCYTGNLPRQLLDVLSDVGVGPLEDAKKLLHDYGIVVSGCLDLRSLDMRNRQTKDHIGLKGLALLYLDVTMNKSKHIQCSNWQSKTLSNEQIHYAANDAFIAARLFSVMSHCKLEDDLQLQAVLRDAVTDTVWSIVTSYCQGLVDCKFKQKNTNQKKNTANTKPNYFKPFKLYSTRKHPLYDNCKLQAPDGQLLSTCDRKKADWYIDKELADIVTETPFTIRLRFEPAGRPASNRDYYLYDKKNACVVCGSDGSIVRKNVVPHEYRRHFPLLLKDHVSHDIVPLCVTCHQRAGYYDSILRSKIAEEYEAPLGSSQAVQLLEDGERRTVRSAGRALENARNKIPEPRRQELEKVVLDFFNEKVITEKLIKEASALETRYRNEAYVAHGLKVVNSIQKERQLKGLFEFERRWREHFLDLMKPQYLPHLWSVEHNHERVGGLVGRDSQNKA